MKLQRALREHIRQFNADAIYSEPWCSCGSPNHARIFLLRVNGQPATALVPEWYELTPATFSKILPDSRVELLSEAELETACDERELGRLQPFENPFGATVFLDGNLLKYETTVFCPRMFSGRRGECYRVPTQELVRLVRPVVLAIAPEREKAAAPTASK